MSKRKKQVTPPAPAAKTEQEKARAFISEMLNRDDVTDFAFVAFTTDGMAHRSILGGDAHRMLYEIAKILTHR